MQNISYQKAIDLLKLCSSDQGFLASAQPISNYKRVWARDGVICGLAALASGDAQLIDTFKKTLETLAQHQHSCGTIPSNVAFTQAGVDVSYGGLAGRVDAVTWYIIGHCQYAYATQNPSWIDQHKASIEKCFALLQAWEFNNKHLLYVPLSGNWADEYIVEGYVLYDQLLRLWALKSYAYFVQSAEIQLKIKQVKQVIEANFTDECPSEKFHPQAHQLHSFDDFFPCCFTPAGYKKPFDAFGNSLALMLEVGSYSFRKRVVRYYENLIEQQKLGMVPAFWPPIFESDPEWNLLKNNCKYEFRNHPYEFHNGGSWPMVNGFVGWAISSYDASLSQQLLTSIHQANAQEQGAFFENFNSQTTQPNGVPQCAWSAAGAVLLHQKLHTNFKLLL
ncbi:fructofuranosidase/invertase [Flavobacterium sp. CYK-55]|uniref:glycoside hydrolase 100 family protein n=1 Tax=Flavobacterium sp. CYK-55 TaxID=2835529 RepID=UPI001BCA7BF5|nr:glycoside hydrolase 100 family protein [Flavobacterium sp. CYK-55]MBS7785889.1 fructofuranosidase/invertase [Flavobacterium sp. CYK-55]